MGRAPSEPSDQTSPIITHFSHPHPLTLSNINLPNSLCTACKHHASGSPAYTCAPCNFILHPKCYQLPQQITHQYHNTHTLSLYPKPVYPEGIFSCDACKHKGDGFSYRCDPCGVDLHTTCSMLPLEFTHHSHQHALSLTFVAPYPGNKFSCDICKKLGSKTWIYRCNGCEYDVHLSCVANIVPPVAPVMYQQSHGITTMTSSLPAAHPMIHTNPQPYTGTNTYGQHQQQQPVAMGQGNYPMGTVQMGTIPNYNNVNQPGKRTNSGLMNNIVGGFAEGVASALAQTGTQAVMGAFGIGGGGGGVVMMDGSVVSDSGAVEGGEYNGGEFGEAA